MIAPLVLFIPKCGLILFEYKEWSFQELKDAQVLKVSYAQKGENSLAFANLCEFIKEKFIDLGGFEDIDIFNFAIMENLQKKEFKQLDERIHELLPASRILFGDTTQEEMAEKLKKLQPKQKNYTVENTLPYIFGQYLILEDSGICFANEEQREFIHTPLRKNTYLQAERLSGKSTVILQKALVELMENNDKKITIFTPTQLHANLLKQKLLEILERTAFVIDIDNIEILDLSNISAEKSLKKEILASYIVFIDDAFAIEALRLRALKTDLKNKLCVYVNDFTEKPTVLLRQNYSKEIQFIEANEFATLLRMLPNLFQERNDIDVIIRRADSDNDSFREDIESYTGKEVGIIDLKENFFEKGSPAIRIGTYDLRDPHVGDYVFLIECCRSDIENLKYFAKSSRKKTFIVYEESCDTIQNLKDILT